MHYFVCSECKGKKLVTQSIFSEVSCCTKERRKQTSSKRTKYEWFLILVTSIKFDITKYLPYFQGNTRIFYKNAKQMYYFVCSECKGKKPATQSIF